MISKKQAIEFLVKGCESLGIAPPSDEKLDQLWLYFTELLKWSARINLVAKAPEPDLLENHFLDCYTMVPVLQDLLAQEPSPTLLDVGSGAGFPGLILKIAFPELQVILVEPRTKRTAFLRHIVRTVRLSNITILEKRIEKDDFQFANEQGRFSFITCRALTKIQEFLAMAAPIAAPGAKIIFMKGPKAEEEIAAWRAESDDGFALTSSTHFTLPVSNADRAIVVFTRTNPLSPPQ